MPRPAFDNRNPETNKQEWLTDPSLLARLGSFDLDPCAPKVRPWPTARLHYTKRENGLVMPWRGRVFMNPPYDRYQVGDWTKRLAEHGDGLALLFARTGTKWFVRDIWQRADAILFLFGHLRFFSRNGKPGKYTAGAPSCLVAYGDRNVKALRASKLPGALIDLRKL